MIWGEILEDFLKMCTCSRLKGGGKCSGRNRRGNRRGRDRKGWSWGKSGERREATLKGRRGLQS